MTIVSYIERKWTHSPVDAIEKLYWKWLRLLVKIVGGDFMNPKFTWKNPLTIFSMIAVGMWMMGPFYTGLYYEDLRMHAVPYFGLGLQGMSKYLTIIVETESCRWICAFLTSLIRKISHDREKRQVLKGPLTVSYIIFFISFCIYSFAFASVGIVSLTQMYLSKKLLTITPIHLPFLNEDENLLGYGINCLWHLISVVIGTCGSVGGDVLFMASIFNTWSFAEAFKIEFERFSKKLMKKSYDDYNKIKIQLNNLVLMHQDILEMLDCMARTYVIMTNSFFSSCPAGIIFIVYIETQMVYIPGYLFLGMFVLQLFVFCLAGTLLEVINDSIYAAVCSSSWHHLEKPEKTIILIMMHRAQSYKCFKYGAVNVVNLCSFVQVMKTVYSFITLLVTTE